MPVSDGMENMSHKMHMANCGGNRYVMREEFGDMVNVFRFTLDEETDYEWDMGKGNE